MGNWTDFFKCLFIETRWNYYESRTILVFFLVNEIRIYGGFTETTIYLLLFAFRTFSKRVSHCIFRAALMSANLNTSRVSTQRIWSKNLHLECNNTFRICLFAFFTFQLKWYFAFSSISNSKMLNEKKKRFDWNIFACVHVHMLCNER